jgi:hypothetical protein
VRRHALFPARGLWKKSIMGDVTDHCPQWREYLCEAEARKAFGIPEASEPKPDARASFVG